MLKSCPVIKKITGSPRNYRKLRMKHFTFLLICLLKNSCSNYLINLSNMELLFYFFTWSVLQSLRELRVVVLLLVVVLVLLMWCFYLPTFVGMGKL